MFLLIISLLNKLWVNSDEYVLTSVQYTLGGSHLLFATPSECSWISMKTSGILLHILQICTSYFIHLYLIIFNFFAFPLFQWNFYVRLQGVPISYPQLLLNLWVDFNENFRHSSTYIGDVHPKAMQMLYEIWLFSIVLVSHIEKWILSYHTWGGTHHLSTIPPWPVNGFQWNMCKSTAKW